MINLMRLSVKLAFELFLKVKISRVIMPFVVAKPYAN